MPFDSTSQPAHASPVSLLPNELLAEIFTQRVGQCVQPHLGPDAWPFGSSRPSWHTRSHLSCDTKCWEWTQMMHVCRRWHDIILDRATLWSCPPLECKSLTETCLARVRGARIIIRRALCEDDDWLLDFLGPQGGFSRCREVVLPKKRHSRVDIQLLMQHLPESMPLLEVLTLTFDVCLPEAFLRGLPRLQSLVLSRCGLEIWHSFPLHNLTTLIICKISDMNFYPSLSDITALLQQTPRLETLVLHCLHGVSDSDAPGRPNFVVSLRALSRLSLSGMPMQALNVFGFLSVPSYAILELKISSPTSSMDISSFLAPLIRKHYQAATPLEGPLPSISGPTNLTAHPRFRSVSVWSALCSATLMASLSPSPRMPWCPRTPEREDDNVAQEIQDDPLLCVALVHHRYLSKSTVLGVFRAIPLESITSLGLIGLELREDQWRELWTTIPALRVLHIDGGFDSVIRPLVISLMPDAGLVSEDCPLPSLEELRIHHAMDFCVHAHLRECLRLRDAAGARLRLLEVDRGSATYDVDAEKTVEEIKRDRSVDEIIWVWSTRK